MSGARPLRVVVTDDEPAAREELKYLLGRMGGVEVVAEAGDGASAIAAVKRFAPDVVFLDIHMPGADGLEVARALRANNPELRVVFATAHDEHAVEAFNLAAADYLLKPFTLERVARAVDRLRPSPKRLVVERRQKTHFVAIDDVLCIVTDAGVVTVCTVDGVRYSSPRTLQELEEAWCTAGGGDRGSPSGPLYRCHRESLVHLRRVATLAPAASGTYRVFLDDPARTELPVARNRVKGLKAALGLTR